MTARPSYAVVPRWRTYLTLGRVSNLPTVWTNAIGGIVLGGAALSFGRAAPLAAAFSLAYVGGMFLNDAYDRRIDARERPDRPICAGAIGAGEVFGVGFALLGAAALLVAFVAVREGTGTLPVVSAIGLAACIVLYDAWHKGNPAGPVIMGACRALVVLTAALAATGRVATAAAIGALVVLAYVAGLTLVAKRVSAALPIAVLIAGISLVDAALVAAHGAWSTAVLLAAGFPLTLLSQRLVRGT